MGGYGEVLMRRLLSLVAVCALLAACGGSAGNGGPTGGDETAGPGSPTDGGIIGGTAGRPSGAKVRIVNVYNGGPTAPSIDVYAAPWVVDGATPLLTVPYGTATDFFDPTVADDSGNMFLSFYRHGETGNGVEVMSQTETLKGGEIITYTLMSDHETRDDGTPKLYLQSLYHAPGGGAFDSTPEPGKGVLLVNMHGVEPAVPRPANDQSWFLSSGNGCQAAIGDKDYTMTAAGPGDGTRYAFDPGEYSLSLNPSISGVIPDCSTPALIAGMKVTIDAGKTTLLVVYAPTATDIKTMVLPLGY